MAGPDMSFERAAHEAGALRVAGVDEVGRGPLAGPVVAAAVILGPAAPEGLDDSKKLSPHVRQTLCDAIMGTCSVSIASVGAAAIDRTNIRAASLEAMRLALAGLTVPPDHVLIDGNAAPPGLRCPAETIVGGDGRSRSIAAASIVAKVLRDRMMVRADGQWTGYGFASHKGYGTKAHRAAIEALGPCPLHRMSFAPLKANGPPRMRRAVREA